MLNITLNAMITGLLYGSMYGIIALGFTLIFGVMNFVNFAHGSFVLLPAYISFFLFASWGIDPYTSLILIIPLSFILGLVVYKYLAIRIIDEPHSVHIILTLALCFFIENGILLVAGSDIRCATTSYSSATFKIGHFIISYSRFCAALVAWFCVILLFIFLKFTDFGVAIRAAADNKEGAKIVGIFVDRVYLIAFGLSTLIAGIAGAVIVPFYLLDPFSGMDIIIKAFCAVVIGGLGSIPGAIVGGLIIGVVECVSGVFLKASLGNSLSFFIMAVVLLVRPSGLFGE